MIDTPAIRSIIAPALKQHLGRQVVMLEQVAPKPAYPFVAYKFTSPFIPEPGQPIIESNVVPGTTFAHDIEEKVITMPTFTLSITAYGKTSDECHSLAKKAYEWFFYFGKDHLNDNGIVVANLLPVSDRTAFLDVAYEYRAGFDVICRVTSTLISRKDTIETVVANGEEI